MLSGFEASIQIAGIRSLDEATMLEQRGVDFIGFPLRLGYHSPDISERTAREIIAHMNEPRRAVLITYITDAQEILAFTREIGVSSVQLHADISVQQLRTLKELAPDLTIIKSLIVRPECAESTHPIYALSQELEPWVDAFITDSFDPSTGATGATGLRHDWAVSARIVKLVQKPLILAGGLNASNVFDAICAVRPAAVDAHTGVENSLGNKCSDLVLRFVSEARRGFAALSQDKQPA
jgi:phosphoribosylanthranilate isomerase